MESKPFIKVTWEDTPENFTSEKSRRVKAYFESKYNTNRVRLETKSTLDSTNAKLKSLEVSDNIFDSQYQKQLIKDFIKEKEIDVTWELLNRLDDKVNAEIDVANKDKIKYNKWHIKKINFSNFLSFGDENEIDFTDLNGITVIESNPKNFGGKTTISVDLLLFLFFNKTTKSKVAADIFNKFTDKNHLSVRGELTIDSDNYIIERTLTRKQSKQGEYNVTNKLEFYKETSDGEVEILNGEQRRVTESIITSAIGTEEDFLLTILTTGRNIEDLIDSKPTARGQILTKFLGLEGLKIKEETAKAMYSEWSKTLISNTYNITQLNSDIEQAEESIVESEEKTIVIANKIGELEETIKVLEQKKDDILLKRNNNIDPELLNVNPTLLKREIGDLQEEVDRCVNNANAVVVVEPSEFYFEEEHEALRSEINEITLNSGVVSSEIKTKEQHIKQFNEGTVCPTCNRAFEEVDHTQEIQKIEDEIKKLQKQIEKNKKKLEDLNKKNDRFKVLKTEYDTYERNKLLKSKHELDGDRKKLEKDTKAQLLTKFEENKIKLEENQKIDAEVVSLKTKIETANADIRVETTNLEKEKNNIITMTEKIKVNQGLIKKINIEQQLIVVFKIYMSIFGKNGIPKVIIKNMIPLLNQELYHLLSDSCYFILELNVNDRNEVEFIMIDTETRVAKLLNSGSGYEKTIASLALRSVLTKISSLPKPNIVVMDEVFGKVADENLDIVGEFFKKIKKYFDHIFVISHNPLIRNWSDNIIMVKKEENVSSIDFITTKI